MKPSQSFCNIINTCARASFFINSLKLQSFSIKKGAPAQLKFLITAFLKLVLKKALLQKTSSHNYQISDYATFYMKLWQDFCILTAGYTKSYYLKKLLKAVNNTPAPEMWRLLTCQNCQMICKPYCWDKQHTNMSPHDRLINGYALLLENDVSFFECFQRPHIDFISTKPFLCDIFE